MMIIFLPNITFFYWQQHEFQQTLLPFGISTVPSAAAAAGGSSDVVVGRGHGGIINVQRFASTDSKRCGWIHGYFSLVGTIAGRFYMYCWFLLSTGGGGRRDDGLLGLALGRLLWLLEALYQCLFLCCFGRGG